MSRFSFDAIVSYRDWIETFQPAFQACGAAGAMSYMCSYNAINGVPACANRELLGDLLRGEWNFTGFVVSDCGGFKLCHKSLPVGITLYNIWTFLCQGLLEMLPRSTSLQGVQKKPQSFVSRQDVTGIVVSQDFASFHSL